MSQGDFNKNDHVTTSFQIKHEKVVEKQLQFLKLPHVD